MTFLIVIGVIALVVFGASLFIPWQEDYLDDDDEGRPWRGDGE